jgi:predicted transcriptional regulator
MRVSAKHLPFFKAKTIFMSEKFEIRIRTNSSEAMDAIKEFANRQKGTEVEEVQSWLFQETGLEEEALSLRLEEALDDLNNQRTVSLEDKSRMINAPTLSN